MFRRLPLSAVILLAAAAPAFAHLDPAEHGSFMAGVSHPLFGMDHILVMVAVGLWAVQIARSGAPSAQWVIPAAFLATMTAGFAIAVAGVELPFVEPAILASVIALGLLVAMAARPPAALCAGIVAIFALFHGHAHGAELGSAGALRFGVGFVVSTALLHMAGVAAGLGIARVDPRLNRLLGGVTAVLGLSLALG